MLLLLVESLLLDQEVPGLLLELELLDAEASLLEELELLSLELLEESELTGGDEDDELNTESFDEELDTSEDETIELLLKLMELRLDDVGLSLLLETELALETALEAEDKELSLGASLEESDVTLEDERLDGDDSELEDSLLALDSDELDERLLSLDEL